MKYISTRGEMEPQNFSEILLSGLAPDGGLSMPESYPSFTEDQLGNMVNLSYADLAYEIVSRFATDIPSSDIKNILRNTYTAEVYCNGRESEKTKEITPITELEENLYLLELSNGPTLAFKDMAMQLLGNLFEYVLEKRNETLNIVGATSGDTGSAAEYAMRGKKKVNLFITSPHNRMSSFQRAQMFSLQDDNIHNIAVKSMFDGCQDMVKSINRDAEFKKKYKIGAVNSINWGRIVAQVVYYFRGYLKVADKIGEPVDFTVPSGNFGNVCAAHIAKQMGLPIRNLVVATNENDVLYEFFNTGEYRPRPNENVFATSSPSMDISKASNLERFVFDLVDRDASTLANLWKSVESGDGFSLSQDLVDKMRKKYGFISEKSTHADRLSAIKSVYEKYNLFIDTHTADGYTAALMRRDNGVKMVITETALACKFEDTIKEALGFEAPRPKHLEGIEDLPQRFVVMDPDPRNLKEFIVKTL